MENRGIAGQRPIARTPEEPPRHERERQVENRDQSGSEQQRIGAQSEEPRPITFAAFSSKVLGIDHPLQHVDADVEIGTDTLHRQVDDGRVDLSDQHAK